MSGWTKEGDTWVPPANVRPHRHDSSEVPVAGATPVGGVIAFYGTTAPTNWLICDGSTFSSSTYPALSVVLGGTTLPNLKGKVIIGVDAAQVEFDVLAETGGSKTLASANLPVHTHGLNSHAHGGSLTHDNNHSAGALNTGSTEPPNHQHDFTSNNTDVNHNHFGKVATNSTAHTHDATDAQFAGRPNGGSLTFTGGNGTDTSIQSVNHAHTGRTAGVVTGISHLHDATHGHTAHSSHTVPGDTGVTTDGGFANTTALPPYMALSYIIRAA